MPTVIRYSILQTAKSGLTEAIKLAPGSASDNGKAGI